MEHSIRDLYFIDIILNLPLMGITPTVLMSYMLYKYNMVLLDVHYAIVSTWRPTTDDSYLTCVVTMYSCRHMYKVVGVLSAHRLVNTDTVCRRTVCKLPNMAGRHDESALWYTHTDESALWYTHTLMSQHFGTNTWWLSTLVQMFYFMLSPQHKDQNV